MKRIDGHDGRVPTNGERAPLEAASAEAPAARAVEEANRQAPGRELAPRAGGADRPEGPWSDVEQFFEPPESEYPCAFVYAGKAHPGLTGADVVVTYVPTVFNGCPYDDPTLYHPHFVRVTLNRP